MAQIQSAIYSDLYNSSYNYSKNGYSITEVPNATKTYRGSVPLAAGLTQKGTGTFPLIHAKDVQIGNIESDRLSDKLADIDQILREIYGCQPSDLEAKTDGRSSMTLQTLRADGAVTGDVGGSGMESLSKLAAILNNRTETVDDRLLDLRGFKAINVTGDSTVVTNLSAADGIPTADSNDDTLYLKTANIWLKLAAVNAAHDEQDTITVGHLVRNIAVTTGATDFNESTSEQKYTGIDIAGSGGLNGNYDGVYNDAQGKFDIDLVSYDEAGHVRSFHRHTCTLPYGYKTISVGAQSSAVTNAVGSAVGDCVADNIVDKLTFYTGNKWINLAANRAGTNANTDDSITISHILSVFTPESATVDYNSATGSFTVVNFVNYDEAGHITGYKTTQYTLPNSFKTIAVSDANSAVTNLSGSNKADCIATGLVDTLTLHEGNKWINIAANRAKGNTNVNNAITFSHALSALQAEAHELIYSLTDVTPSFGDTVTIVNPSISFTTDEAGHVTAFSSSNNTVTFTIPQPSLIDNVANGNVIVGLSLVKNAGEFTTSRVNVGTLALTGYNKGEASETVAIVNTDSINQAFAKLEHSIDSTNSAISAHVENVENPHNVTKEQVGLGSVENKSVAEILEDAALTGNPTAPTPLVDSNDTSVATTEFVNNFTLNFTTPIMTDEEIDAAILAAENAEEDAGE